MIDFDHYKKYSTKTWKYMTNFLVQIDDIGIVRTRRLSSFVYTVLKNHQSKIFLDLRVMTNISLTEITQLWAIVDRYRFDSLSMTYFHRVIVHGPYCMGHTVWVIDYGSSQFKSLKLAIVKMNFHQDW